VDTLRRSLVEDILAPIYEIASRNELAEKLRVKPLTISRYIKAGKLPEPVCFGQKLLFKESDIDKLLEKLILVD
jgi:excisionase family DNA binding protein